MIQIFSLVFQPFYHSLKMDKCISFSGNQYFITPLPGLDFSCFSLLNFVMLW